MTTVNSTAPENSTKDQEAATGTSSDKPLHILYLTHYFPPEGNAPASRVHEMGKRWVKAGNKVTVITCAPNHPAGKIYTGYKNRWKQRETIDGIEVIRVWTFLAPNKGAVRRILNYISYMFTAILAAIFVRKPDIFIATSPQFFCGVAGILVKLLKRRPFILEIRDIWPESISTVGALKSRILLKPLEWLERLMYRSATHIVTVGSGYKTQLEAKGIPSDKISIITNGIDPEVYYPRPKDQALLARHGLTGKFVCGVIGTLGMASGLDIVIRAATQLRDQGNTDIAFLLVGDGAIRADLERQAKEANLTNVIFAGRQPKELMPAYLASVDVCLVHLIKKDLFRYVLPSKIFEAAAMERPIILGVQGCAADLVTEANAGLLIDPENTEQLTAQLMALSNNPSKAQALGSSGRKFVLQNYDRGQMSTSYMNTLQFHLHTTSVQDSQCPSRS